MESARLLTLPNVISLSRLVLAAAFVTTRDPILRVGLIVTASATDFLDGWLARRRQSATKWGALIDPIADRVFVLTAVSSYLLTGEVSTGQYFILLSRDLATAVGFLVAQSVAWLRPVEFRARWLGKVVTALQFLALLAVILQPSQVPWLVLLTGIVSAASIADYTLALWRARVT